VTVLTASTLVGGILTWALPLLTAIAAIAFLVRVIRRLEERR
jgi:hypothetical protein